MYKVLKPLGGYGYLVGDITEHIAEADIPKLLQLKFIEIIQDQPSESPKPSKTSRKRTS